jgi:hypothetical protein
VSPLLARRTPFTAPSRTVQVIGAHGADEVNAVERERGICESKARLRPTNIRERAPCSSPDPAAPARTTSPRHSATPPCAKAMTCYLRLSQAPKWLRESADSGMMSEAFCYPSSDDANRR